MLGLIAQVDARETVYVSVTGRGNQSFNWFAKASGTGGQTGAYTLTSSLKALSTLPSGGSAPLSDAFFDLTRGEA